MSSRHLHRSGRKRGMTPEPQPEDSKGDIVYVKNFSNGPAWLPAGVVVRERGPLRFNVRLADGRDVRRHVDHMCACAEEWQGDNSTSRCP